MTHRKEPHRDLGRAGQPVPTYPGPDRGQAGRTDRYDFLARLAYLRQTGCAIERLEDRTPRPDVDVLEDLARTGLAAAPSRRAR